MGRKTNFAVLTAATLGPPAVGWYFFWKYIAPRLIPLIFYAGVALLIPIAAPFLLIDNLIKGDWEGVFISFMMCGFTCLAIYAFLDIKKTIKREREKAQYRQEYINKRAPITDQEHNALKVLKARAEAGETEAELRTKCQEEWAIYKRYKSMVGDAEADLAMQDLTEIKKELATEKAVKIVPAYLANGYDEAYIQAHYPAEWALYVEAGKPPPPLKLQIPSLKQTNHVGTLEGVLIIVVVLAVVIFYGYIKLH